MKQVRNFVRELTSNYMYSTLLVEEKNTLGFMNVVVHSRYTKLHVCACTNVHDDYIYLL